MPHWYYTPMLFLPSLHHLPFFFQKLPCSKACRTGTKATPKERGLPNLPIAIGLASHHQSCDFGMSMDWNFSATKNGEIENETLETPFLFIGKIDGFRWRLSQPIHWQFVPWWPNLSVTSLKGVPWIVMGAPFIAGWFISWKSMEILKTHGGHVFI